MGDPTPIVCRRMADSHRPGVILPDYYVRQTCSVCQMGIMVERGLDTSTDPKMCIHCAAPQHPDLMLFVELPPDEFGRRSMSVSLQQVYERDAGEWHKHGVWHDSRWVFAHAE